MKSVPFCIVEKPYMIWSADVAEDNANFLERIDANLYYRTAHTITLSTFILMVSNGINVGVTKPIRRASPSLLRTVFL